MCVMAWVILACVGSFLVGEAVGRLAERAKGKKR